MNLSQRILLNTVVQIAGKLAVLVATLVTVRLTTTYLGVQGYGSYAIVLALIPILLAFSDLGISTLLARELAKTPERRNELGGTLLWFRLISVAAVLGIAAAIVPFLPYKHEVKVGVAIAAAGVLALSFSSFVTPFFQVNLRLDLTALLDLVTSAVAVSLIAVATQLDLGFYAVVGATAAASTVNFVLSFLLSRRFWRPNLSLDVAAGKRLFGDAVPLAAVIVLGLLHFKIDAVLLSLLKPAAAVGIYNVAYRFLDQALILPWLFMGAVFPVLTGAVSRNEEFAPNIIVRAFNFLLLLAVPLAIGLALLAKPLVHLVATDEFDASVKPLQILSLALILAFANSTFAYLLIALNRQRVLAVVSVIGVMLNVGLNLYFIPRWSYTGAAITTVITEGFGTVIVFGLARRAYAFGLSRGFLVRLAAAAGVMAAILFALRSSSALLAGVVATAAFVLAVRVLRVITRSDLSLMLGRSEQA